MRMYRVPRHVRDSVFGAPCHRRPARTKVHNTKARLTVSLLNTNTSAGSSFDDVAPVYASASVLFDSLRRDADTADSLFDLWASMSVDASIPEPLLDNVHRLASTVVEFLDQALEGVDLFDPAQSPEDNAVAVAVASALLPRLVTDMTAMCHGLPKATQERLVFLATSWPAYSHTGTALIRFIRDLLWYYLSELAADGDDVYPLAVTPSGGEGAPPFVCWMHDDGYIETDVLFLLPSEAESESMRRAVNAAQVGLDISPEDRLTRTMWIGLFGDDFKAWKSESGGCRSYPSSLGVHRWSRSTRPSGTSAA